MTLDGEPYRPRGTHDAVRAGIFLVPEERRSQGLILRESLAFNIDLPSWGLMQVGTGVPLINKREGARRAAEVVKALRIKADSVRTPVSQLSGGNQQKVVIGRWLGPGSRVLLLDEPTRGVDVGARAEIQTIIRRLADEGRAILVISSEFEELRWCDRVLVVVEGRVVGQLVNEEITEEAMLRLCYSISGAS